jgi:hypothetical protein
MEILKQSGLPCPRIGGPSTGSGQAWEPPLLVFFHLLRMYGKLQDSEVFHVQPQ